MRSLSVTYIGGKAVVDFAAEMSGVQALCSRVLATAWTKRGSDLAFRSRGSDLVSRLAGGASDHTNVQHELNFASVSVAKSFRVTEPGSLESVSMRLTGASGQQRSVSTSITDGSGTVFGIITETL